MRIHSVVRTDHVEDGRGEVTVKCPATGEVVGSVAVTTTAVVAAGADRLRAAQPGWQQLQLLGQVVSNVSSHSRSPAWNFRVATYSSHPIDAARHFAQLVYFRG